MADFNDDLETTADSDGPQLPREKAPAIESRFLFVDVAAMRAKQLRRGAVPRLSDQDEEASVHRAAPHKAERVAMEEVRRRLVLYEVPPTPNKPVEQSGS
jgi:DNA-directed RNA polymerase subunit K/omega